MRTKKLAARFPLGCYIETLIAIPYAGPAGLTCYLPGMTRARVIQVDDRAKRLKIARISQSPIGEWWIDADNVKGAGASLR